MLAAALLTVISFHSLFAGTVVGFLASAALVVSVQLPSARKPERRSIYERTTRGMRLYLATPRLRGLLAISLSVAAAGSMVIVNTVVFVQSKLGLAQDDTALALAAFGGGSMIVALALPRLLDRMPDRPVMLASVGILVAGLIATSFIQSYALLLAVWLVIGIGYSGAQTPSGRLLRRSAHAEDRPSLFAAQFALSHACWLLTYPLAGWLGAKIGLPSTALVLCAIAVAGLALAAWLWPTSSDSVLVHSHEGLPENDPHLKEGTPHGAHRHSHPVVIDSLHPVWPRER